MELVTRGTKDAEDAASVASFAFTLSSLTSIFVSLIALLARVLPQAHEQTSQAIIGTAGIIAMVFLFFLWGRTAGLKAEQIGEKIWFGLSPRQYAILLTIATAILVLAAAQLNESSTITQMPKGGP